MSLIDATSLTAAILVGNALDKVRTLEDVLRIIEDEPTINPEDLRPQGEWDAIPNTYMSVASKDGSYSRNATSCSVCHEINPNAYKTNYRPNCGARMKGEGRE